jgi:HAD superfamily phosphoserine phosphatase-like hydrolase
MADIKLVCFDVDGTLVEGASWYILAESLGCSPGLIQDLSLRVQKGELSLDRAELQVRTLFLDTGKATRPFIEHVFEQIPLRPEVLPLISYLNIHNYPIYLISGAIDLFVQKIAEKLAVDGFYANTSFEFDQDGVLRKIDYHPEQGKMKVEQLTKLISEFGIRMDQVAYIGDSDNDIEAFQSTGHGIAVHCTSDQLLKVAWRVVDSLAKIQTIL